MTWLRLDDDVDPRRVAEAIKALGYEVRWERGKLTVHAGKERTKAVVLPLPRRSSPVRKRPWWEPEPPGAA